MSSLFPVHDDTFPTSSTSASKKEKGDHPDDHHSKTIPSNWMELPLWMGDDNDDDSNSNSRSLYDIPDNTSSSMLLQSLIKNKSTSSMDHPIISFIRQGPRQKLPSLDERLRLYMGNWYLPPCHENDKFTYRYLNDSMGWLAVEIQVPKYHSSAGTNHSKNSSSSLRLVVESAVKSDSTFVVEEETLDDCKRLYRKYVRDRVKRRTDSRIEKRLFMHWYCEDVVQLLAWNRQMDHDDDESWTRQNNAADMTRSRTTLGVPLLVHFGDSEPDKPFLPLFAKYRGRSSIEQQKRYIADAATSDNNNSKGCISSSDRQPWEVIRSHSGHMHLAPILWQLNKKRHWLPLQTIRRRVIRSTNHRDDDFDAWERKLDKAIWLGELTGKPVYDVALNFTAEQRCRQNNRCNFVMQYHNSNWIHAGLTGTADGAYGIHADSISHIPTLLKPKIGMDDMLEYKILISLEGNDMASGLKWQLYTPNNVVMMPPPTFTSWAMEEWLEPWVHYIPIFPNGSNAEDMVQWALQHETISQEIAQRGRLFIQQLVDEQQDDDEWIRKEILRRYRAHWRRAADEDGD